ncbi:MAG: hypothetical protein HBSAPP02_14470 [Phycisphaerae bacterium]|nr:MAG: tRNA lysidine(34) synthetase TilS [Planctomycetia bacterium]RIK71298.1 MAG: tRNA lysidine(34) synthetase TilS [Planctomycetota bacterium]GJQ26415.1 MAG: hypothetical protein HBSAPP02_14470 [Phycisphaerae bacterium]
MDIRHFHRRLYESSRDLLPPGEAVVCAVSGGADSLAMLHGLHEINRRKQCGWRLIVAHLDHGLRADSAATRQFVESVAAKLALPCVDGVADVAALARRAKQSVETAGRARRYAFLAEVAKRHGARYIAVAHHADDQAETVLHRILRGTGLRGLAGIPRRRRLHPNSDIRIVRPMLSFTRETLHAYLRRRGVSFLDDPTNADPSAATRNHLRHDVLPRLARDVNPRVQQALVRLGDQARAASTAIRRSARGALNRAKRAADECGRAAAGRFTYPEAVASCVISVTPLLELPTAIQREAVVLLLNRLGWPRCSMTAERIDAVAKLLRMDGRRRRVELPGGCFERSGEWVCASRREIGGRGASNPIPHGRGSEQALGRERASRRRKSSRRLASTLEGAGH